MEAKDLRIGDWVYNTMDGNETPCKVSLDDFKDESEGLHPFSVFEPIPLTKELLAVNGFIHDGHYVFFPHGEELDNCYIDCGIRRNSEVRTIEIVNYSRGFKLGRAEYIYVHEFQHALRLCGLNDLADNFKIE